MKQINLRGETVANDSKKVKIKALAGVVGEGGKDILKGDVREVSESFARDLIRRGKAELAEDSKK